MFTVEIGSLLLGKPDRQEQGNDTREHGAQRQKRLEGLLQHGAFALKASRSSGGSKRLSIEDLRRPNHREEPIGT